MKKLEFLAQLRKNLAGLPEEDIKKSLDYYSEIIDDRMEDGLTEEEAVGDPGEIAAQILSELPLGKLVKAKLKPRRRMGVWEIALLLLGAPLWLPILIAVLAVILAIYMSIWSVVVSLYGADLALAVSAVVCALTAVPYALGASPAAGAFILGGGLILAGLAIFLFFACNLAAKGALWIGKMILRGIKACFIRKETAQ